MLQYYVVLVCGYCGYGIIVSMLMHTWHAMIGLAQYCRGNNSQGQWYLQKQYLHIQQQQESMDLYLILWSVQNSAPFI